MHVNQSHQGNLRKQEWTSKFGLKINQEGKYKKKKGNISRGSFKEVIYRGLVFLLAFEKVIDIIRNVKTSPQYTTPSRSKM